VPFESGGSKETSSTIDTSATDCARLSGARPALRGDAIIDKSKILANGSFAAVGVP